MVGITNIPKTDCLFCCLDSVLSCFSCCSFISRALIRVSFVPVLHGQEVRLWLYGLFY